MIPINVIDFHQIAFSKRQFAPATFSLLLLEELGTFSPKQRMIFQSLTPIQQISILWAGLSSDFSIWRENMGGRTLTRVGFWLTQPGKAQEEGRIGEESRQAAREREPAKKKKMRDTFLCQSGGKRCQLLLRQAEQKCKRKSETCDLV